MNLFLLLLLVLATYRLSRLISRDLILSELRLWLGRQAAAHPVGWPWLAELFTCPHCLGVWIAALAALLYAHSILEWALYTLAIAGGQSFLQDIADHA